MTRFFKHVDDTLPLAIELSPEEEEIQNSVFESEVLGLEAESLIKVCDKVSQLGVVLNDFETFVDADDTIALEMLEYVGSEVLSYPSLEKTDDEAGFIVRAWEAVKKFLVRIYTWVKGKLKALANAIMSRLGISKNRIRELKKDMGNGTVNAFVMELPFDPKDHGSHLQELGKSFKRTTSLPKDLNPEELETFRLENDIRDRALGKALGALGVKVGTSAIDSKSDKQGFTETTELVNGYRVTIDEALLTSMEAYQVELQKVFDEAKKVLTNLKDKVESKKVNPDTLTVEAGKEQVRAANLAMQVVTKLMKASSDSVERILASAEENKTAK